MPPPAPESCAAIIYRDSALAEKAAEALRLTAPDLLRLGLIDGVIEEPGEGAHAEPDAASYHLANQVVAALDELAAIPPRQLIDERYEKFRKMGSFFAEAQ